MFGNKLPRRLTGQPRHRRSRLQALQAVSITGPAELRTDTAAQMLYFAQADNFWRHDIHGGYPTLQALTNIVYHQ